MQKKQNIIRAATRLFSAQGFDGTTTLQISQEAQVTEPLIYYHFKGKDDLFTHILEAAFNDYFALLEELPRDTDTQFEKIQNLLDLHIDILTKWPDETYLIVSTCPAKLNDENHICAKNNAQLRTSLKDYVNETLAQGVRSGEFEPVAQKETAVLIIAMISGLVRNRPIPYDSLEDIRKAAVDFLKRSLVRS